ncbi:MAG: sigma factor-like helix-turn-helix DNA-binding protein [Nitrospinales bacterium]
MKLQNGNQMPVDGRLSERDQAIVAARRTGATYREIGERFGVSGSRLQQIISMYERTKRDLERVEVLRTEIRGANDCDKKWPIDFVLEAVAFPFLPARAIKRWCNEKGQLELSLNDLMDYALPEDPTFDAYGWVKSPATQQRGVGRKTYKALIKHLTERNLGEKYNEEWGRRIKNLLP